MKDEQPGPRGYSDEYLSTPRIGPWRLPPLSAAMRENEARVADREGRLIKLTYRMLSIWPGEMS